MKPKPVPGREEARTVNKLQPLADSTALLKNPSALRERARQDGYLLFRNLLPSRTVDAVGSQLAEIMASADWIEAGKALGAAEAQLIQRCVEPQPAFMEVFYAQLALQSLHALKARSELLHAVEKFVARPSWCVPHCVMRMAFPQMDAYATPPHQDFVHFEGSQENWAAWIPFTSINQTTGGLAIAAGSHLAGPYDMRPCLGAGQMEIDADLDALDWRWSPMEPGDVLFHNCLTVHKGLPNNSKTMRVSVDARYQPLAEPVGEKYLGVSHQMRTWDELYAGWQDDTYQYYWKNLELDVVPFTFHWYDRRDRRAIEMGNAGDANAAVALENITLKHRDPMMRKAAEAALATLKDSATVC